MKIKKGFSYIKLFSYNVLANNLDKYILFEENHMKHINELILVFTAVVFFVLFCFSLGKDVIIQLANTSSKEVHLDLSR